MDRGGKGFGFFFFFKGMYDLIEAVDFIIVSTVKRKLKF